MESKVELKELLNFSFIACKVNVVESTEEIKTCEEDLKTLLCSPLINSLFKHFENASDGSDQLCGYLLNKNKKKNLDTSYVETPWEHCIDKKLNEIVRVMKTRLTFLMSEGMFDSILPYIGRNSKVASNYLQVLENKDKIFSQTKKRKEKKKKNIESKISVIPENCLEMEIHVYDEVKGVKRNFKLQQNSLVSHMGYFFEIAKRQKLEEMDITVHCDIETFEWLLKWVKQNTSDSSLPPRLDYKNVARIMVSANFLQMHLLFQNCLQFFKSNLNDVIKFSTNMNSLNDYILMKLADKLSNIEIQNLRDRKDKLKSKLFCKFIMSLNGEEPQKHRGHFASLAYLYFCAYCNKFVTTTSAPYVPCRVQYASIECNGEVVFNHLRDPKWDINSHIRSIWADYKNWSNTYWRLWSQCHFLYCDMCRTMYAVAFSDCCPYHPQQPHFYPIDQVESTISSAIGRYPCCGSKAVRYETIMIRSGCKLRSHMPKLMTYDDTRIKTLIDSFPDLIKIKCADYKMSPLVEDYDSISFDYIFKNTILYEDHPNMNGGLIKGPLYDIYIKTLQAYKTSSNWGAKKYCFVPKLNESYEHFDYSSIGESETSEISYIRDLSPNYEGGSPSYEENIQLDILIDNKQGPSWSSIYSIRHNQDNLRDNEEASFQAMSSVLMNLQQNNLKQSSKKSATHNDNVQVGGTYVKIETEWKESHLKISGNKYVTK